MILLLFCWRSRAYSTINVYFKNFYLFVTVQTLIFIIDLNFKFTAHITTVAVILLIV